MSQCTKRHDLTAVIYDKRGRILSVGKNNYSKTHPMQKRYAIKVGVPNKQFIHAEIAAIVNCRNLDKAYRIRILRFHRDGSPALAKPCTICMAAITAAGIAVIDHT